MRPDESWRWAKQVLPWWRSAITRPARATAPALLSSSSRASENRDFRAPAQCVTGNRPPKGLTPRPRQPPSFSIRRRISSLASAGNALSATALALGSRGGQERLDEGLDAAVHDRFDVAHLGAGAVVLDDLV